MPNTYPRSSTRTPSPSRYSSPSRHIPAFHSLAAPVPDLASTLTIQDETDVNADNVSFLRTQFLPHDETVQAETTTQPSQSSHPRSSLLSYHRNTHHDRLNSTRNRTRSPYGDRTPSQQSLYDWAPITDLPYHQEVDHATRLLRIQQPNTHPDIIGVIAHNHVNIDRQNRSQLQSSTAFTTQSEGSLRSAAILHSARSRNRQMSQRSRDLLRRYNLDRPPAADEAPNNDQSGSNAVAMLETGRYENNRVAWQASQGTSDNAASTSESSATNTVVPGGGASRSETLDSMMRRRFLEDPTPTTPTTFEAAILNFQSLLGEQGHRTSACNHLHHGFPPAQSSWLRNGTSFLGWQQAAPTPAFTTVHQVVNDPNSHQTLVEPLLRLDPDFVSTPLPTVVTEVPNPPDVWTVKVNIHTVNYETMKLQGTMEAFNVPSAPHNYLRRNTDKKSFSTYVEGELIDFNRHTLLTQSFRSNPTIDATYWSKLEPFRSFIGPMNPEAIFGRPFLAKEVTEKYLLMRWKEVCFVKPTTSAVGPQAVGAPAGAENDEYGLSISGFYFISMRRSDGRIEGLYHDPNSSPYQHLQLKSNMAIARKFTSGAMDFR